LLLRELENELKHLDEIDDDDFNNSTDPYLSDHILDRLQTIAKESARYDLKEIEKLCKLAIGKRILNIELKKKKDEHNSVHLYLCRN
jgi:primosomal protein N''